MHNTYSLHLTDYFLDSLTFWHLGVICSVEVQMNSIRKFVQSLVYNDSIMVLCFEEYEQIGKMESSLLEDGVIFYKDFMSAPFYKQNGKGQISWVVIFEEKPYLVSGFDLTKPNEIIKVVIHLREIREGEKLPLTLEIAKHELVLELMHFGSSIRLANCPQKTFEWLKSHKATKKVIDRISKPA